MTIPQRSTAADNDRRWWLPAEAAIGDTQHVRVGPLALHAHRTASEWQLAFDRAEESDELSGVERTTSPDALAADELERFMFARTAGHLSLLPVLADRPVVIRPRQPVFVPSGEEVTLYMSSPVTIRVLVGQPGIVLREVPSVCLSDTWFGPSTREGELCYAGRTNARQRLGDVPTRAHRAITAARIRNTADAPLPLDKLSLPVPLLSIYGTPQGGLWTESVSLVQGSDSELATLHIDAGAPSYAGEAELISGPRRKADRGGLVRAFNALFRDTP